MPAGFKAQGVLQHFSTIKNDLQNTDDRNQWVKTEFGESMADGAGLYQENLLEQNMLDFDDMMLWSIRLLHETSRRAGEAPGPVRAPARRRVQDTNLPQYVFIRQLANDRNNVFRRGRPRLGPVNTYLSASKMSTKWMKPMNITSSFSNRENIRR